MQEEKSIILNTCHLTLAHSASNLFSISVAPEKRGTEEEQAGQSHPSTTPAPLEEQLSLFPEIATDIKQHQA